MRYLLDTCALLWLAADQSQLSPRAVAVLSESDTELFVSAISAFEVGIKHTRGKNVLPLPPEEWFLRAINQHNVEPLPVNWGIAIRSTQLPDLHRDPADRIIIATARYYGFSILTSDRLIHQYPDVVVIW